MLLDPPILRPVCDFTVELDPIIEMGAGSSGQRRIIPIIGGKVSGERLNGEILHLGADWQTVHSDGLAALDARYAIRTHDGAIIEVRNSAIRHGPPEVMARVAAGEAVDPSLYYMRGHLRLETGDPRYGWVNRALFVCSGGRLAASVILSIWELG
jgi:hypothetical protein